MGFKQRRSPPSLKQKKTNAVRMKKGLPGAASLQRPFASPFSSNLSIAITQDGKECRMQHSLLMGMTMAMMFSLSCLGLVDREIHSKR